jgi:hypothetical protein
MIFESGHDYGKTMREAMYGWMTLHLKEEGQGNPIPEPALTPEDPEALRCYPGQSRPADFVTLPRFAAAEAARQIDRHDRDHPQHVEDWNNQAMRMRHILERQVLGGFPERTPTAVTILGEQASQVLSIKIGTEPGIEAFVRVSRGRDDAKRLTIVVDLDGIEHARESELVKALEKAGGGLAIVEPRATGRFAVGGDKIGRAPDHNSTEWAILTGRPLLGQWIWDLRMALDVITRQEKNVADGPTLIGLGPAGLVALGTAIYEPRIARVALIGTLASFKSDVPYVNQRMGIMAPRILRDAGDVAHLAALVGPRKVMISGGVTGGGEPLSAAALGEQFAYTRKIYRLLGIEAHLTVADAEPPDDLARRLMS